MDLHLSYSYVILSIPFNLTLNNNRVKRSTISDKMIQVIAKISFFRDLELIVRQIAQSNYSNSLKWKLKALNSS